MSVPSCREGLKVVAGLLIVHSLPATFAAAAFVAALAAAAVALIPAADGR